MAGENGARFSEALRRLRREHKLTSKEFAKRLNISPSYVSHLEAGRERGSSEIARRADQELDAGGTLWKAWQDDEPGTQSEPASGHTTTEILVLEDDAVLQYDGSVYRLRMRRRLRNTGTTPVTRYLVRIAVDRHPGEPERSNALYRSHPLTWDELQLTAHCGDEPMTWTVKADRDAFKEAWLEFTNAQTRFPLYPGQEAQITYQYTVGSDKWGSWFQRAVRLPTRALTVSLSFPAETRPAVWGTETSLSADAVPLRTAPQRIVQDDAVVFTWATLDPPLHSRYRLEWRLQEPHNEESDPLITPEKPSTAMAGAGIVQENNPILRVPARPFDLPAEASEAEAIVSELLSAAERVRQLHTFGKGMGIAAPQIGRDRAAAIVLPPEAGTAPLILLNAEVVESSAEQDEQYEGCLSFFDVRGLVPRPLSVVVAHTGLDGTRRLTRFEHGLARLVLHEVDHLHGLLYRSRMRDGVAPIPVELYRGTGQQWTYTQR
ncbi:hypothetical protein T261_0737 [Streptomyces lydicus]|nr:hypothetical protein T261_0737 [Streptomyces lydicus]